MSTFIYKARDNSGALITGSLEADKREIIEAQLDGMGLIPITVKESKSQFFRKDISDVFEKITDVDLILFTRQLSTLYKAGIPLLQGLETLIDQVEKKKFKEIIKKIVKDIEEGKSLATAISHYPKVFNEVYISMIEAGEAAGILADILDRLCLMIETDAENRSRIKAATLYPKIVVLAIVVAIVVMMTFVVPSFAKLYSGYNATLPLPTRMLIGISNFFADAWYIIFALIIIATLSVRRYIKTERGAFALDKWKLKFPIFGPIILKSTLSRFARVLGSLFRSGIPVLEAFDIVSRTVDNKIVSKVVREIRESVKSGKNIADPMGNVESFPNLFPSMVVQMVAIGESTGSLDEMLLKVSDYLDQEAAYSIKNLTTSLEPILLLFIFAMVLFLALAIFLPMWDLVKLTGR